MNNTTQMTALAIFTAATTGFAVGGTLDLDRAYAAELKSDAGARSVLNQSNVSNIELSVGVRFNYTYNSTNGNVPSDDDTTIGFQFSDAEVAIEGDVTENMHARLSFDFGPRDEFSLAPTGSAVLEDAYVDWAVNEDFTLRVGQFVPAYSDESSTSEFNMMSSYRSVTHELIGTPGWTQGIEAHFGGDTWDLVVGLNDGANTQSLAFNSGLEMDFGINARFDFYSDSDKARFDDQTSWRGSENGWRVGAGLYFESFGDTNPSSTDTLDVIWYTADATFEGDGWAVRAALYGASMTYDNFTVRDYTNYGLEIGGSVFLSDQWEAFARWDSLFLDEDSAGPQVTPGGDDVQSFIAIGANYYFVPESHAAKFTLELGLALNETNDIRNNNGNTGGGVPVGWLLRSSGFFRDVAGEDGQMYISGTMQWLF